MVSAGTVLEGKYRLVEPIGQGGMGSVWRAEHVKLALGVAIKFIHAIDEPVAVARFLREARIAAQVRHRHVVSMTDFGSTPDGAPYLVMELLDGENLSVRMAREPRMPVLPLFELVAGALSGLEAVHAAGIVHRDVKPANVFLVREVDGVVPKIVDFGTSRATAEARAASETITATGMLVGTPYYMSEEQARGWKDVDARTDLYSMGVILYEALTGRVPFDADTLHELMRQIVTAKPVPLSKHRPDLPAEVVAVVEKAMARDRKARYQTARELRHALLVAMGVASSDWIPPTLVRQTPVQPAMAAPEISMAATAPVDRLSSAPTVESDRVLVDASREPLSRPRWPVVAAAVAVVLACGGAGLALALRDRGPAPSSMAMALAPPVPSPVRPPAIATPALPPLAAVARPVPNLPAPAPAEPAVTVRLLGLPADCVVRVDGEVMAGPDLLLPRDDRVRRIEVSAPGRRAWSIEHECATDGEYRIELIELAPPPPDPLATRQRVTSKRPALVPDGGPRPTHRPTVPSKLLGDPGF
ncbi:MAG: serine/threonine protein kinase [Deltaproteobacteria bacterium]|nr:serine/threonine protein kinase [Deltaproteobacteria bacterium]